MTMKVRVLCMAAVLVGTLWLAGCDHYTCGVTFGNSSCSTSGSGISQSGTSYTQTAFVYFIDPKAGQMAAEGMNVNNSQAFTALSSFQTPTLPSNSGGEITIVNKQFLYAQFLNGSLYGFQINGSTGGLTAISNASPYPSIGSTIAADPKGQFLFVGGGSGITMLSVGSDGTLTQLGSPASTGGATPVQMTTDGAGKYLYAVDGTEILAYSYSLSGLTPVSGSPFTATSNTQFDVVQLAPESTGTFMFGITQRVGESFGVVDNHIYVFGISNGVLAPVTGSPFATTNPPAYIAVSPVSTNVYTFNETFSGSDDNTVTLEPIEGYAFSSAGALTPLSSSPFSTILASSGQFDQSGKYMFIIGQETNAPEAGVLPLTVSSTGALAAPLSSLGAISSIYAVTDAP